jgi:hypothetical protein
MPAARIAIVPISLAALLVATHVRATQCVNPGGTGGCHASIQAAVDAALDGETVHVQAGTYSEFTTVGPDRRLDIEGEGPGITVIDGGIGIDRRSHVRVLDMTIANGGVGVRIESGAFVGIDGCEVKDHIAYGIQVYGYVGITDSVVSANQTAVSALGAQVIMRGTTLTGNIYGLEVAYAPGRRSVIDIGASVIENTTTGGGIMLNSARATVFDSTIRGNGFVGVRADFRTRLTIERSTISGNDAGMVIATGSVKLVNSTVSGNTGGGIRVTSHGRLGVSSSTVAANTAAASGGGIFVDAGGIVYLVNTILADNTAPAGMECAGRLRSRGFNLIETDEPVACEIAGSAGGNLIGVDPMLGPLAANGGPTETHALLAGSPAIDAGNPALLSGRGRACPRTDQRFVDREPTLPCDIGAYEAP